MMKKTWGMIYLLTFIFSFALGIFLTPFLSPSFAGIEKVNWDESMGTIVTDLPYAQGALNKFDLYLPRDQHKATKLVVYIHAGGFTGGDKADDEHIAKYFSSKGYVTATINYSLRNENNNVNVLQMSEEIKQGISAIVLAAEQRGFKLDGMAVAGGSAGGTLAMIYAYRDAEQAPIPVKMVISMVGPASFDPSKWFGLDNHYVSDETAIVGANFVSIMTGEHVSAQMMRSGQFQHILKPITPSALLTPQAPPTLVAYGALDKVAPFAASAALIEALKTQGVIHDVIIFPNSGHALNRDRKMANKLGEKINDYLETYMPIN